MHPYSIDNNDRFRILWIVIPMAVITAWILHEYLLPNISVYKELKWLLRIPTSALALIYVFYKWFEKDLWHRFNNLFGLVKTPNLSGIYQGTLKSSRDNFQTETVITVKIEQTLRYLLLILSTSTSSSKSEMAALIPDAPDGPMLIYSFHNDHKKISKPEMQYHRGMSSLIYNEKEASLNGTYFTSPERGYHGEIFLKKTLK
tara:strand:- start:10374 stop:10979 length:606 start_codon:yes stop_codon:yes gene_type:complete